MSQVDAHAPCLVHSISPGLQKHRQETEVVSHGNQGHGQADAAEPCVTVILEPVPIERQRQPAVC